MPSLIACPNCHCKFSPAVSCPLRQCPPNSMICQACQGTTLPCFMQGISQFPLPYVCRHWLQIPHSEIPFSLSSHCHPLSKDLNTRPVKCSFPCQNNEKNLHRVITNRSPCSNNGISFVKDNSAGSLVTSGISSTNLDSFLNSSEEHLAHCNGMLNGVVLTSLWSKEDDLRILTLTKEELENSGWYYGSMTWQEAASVLANSSEGTFLIRDSSSRRCLFALSVQTPQGPTSIRIEYERGRFWLDCEKRGITPQLNGVIELVEHYRTLAISKDEKSETYKKIQHSSKHVWIDHKGRIFCPITVIRPLRKNPPSLQHLCRLSINSYSLEEIQLSSLPFSLRLYIKKYPYSL